MVAVFVGLVGLLAVLSQLCLGALMKNLGCKHTIMLGLLFEMLQLLWYGFGTTTWMMWGAGILASMSSITYPAISAFVSIHSNADRQGVVQGNCKRCTSMHTFFTSHTFKHCQEIFQKPIRLESARTM